MFRSMSGIKCSFCNACIADLTEAIAGLNAFMCGMCVVRLVENMKSSPAAPHVLFRDPQQDASTLGAWLRACGIDAASAMDKPFGEILETYRTRRIRSSARVKIDAPSAESFKPDQDMLEMLGVEACRKHRVFPIRMEQSRLLLAMADPNNLCAIDDVKFITGYPVEIVEVNEEWIMSMLEKCGNKP